MNWARFMCLMVTVAAASACAKSHDLAEFNNTYIGQLNDDCDGDVYLLAHVTSGKLLLPLPNRRDISGTVAPDGTTKAAGDWSDEHGPVHAELYGHISGKALGHTLTATIHDDRCNPDIVLAPKPSK